MIRTLVIAILAASSVAYAGELSKEQCIDAHGRGQDAKDQGKLTLARKLFLSCAQPSCPQLVSSDCARFADDLARLQPSVIFAARDGSGADLPDTTVYVDDMLVVTRLDDGRPHELDPGKHTMRFQNAGHDQTVTVVIGATFGASPHVQSNTSAMIKTDAAPQKEPKATHPTGARALLYGGAALAVVGGALGTFELLRVPGGCSVSDHTCAAAPGDPVFDDAKSAVRMANIGWTVSALGLAAVVGGAVWWFTGEKKSEPKEHFAIAPWASPGAGGFVLAGEL